jgi:hypothetical protein
MSLQVVKPTLTGTKRVQVGRVNYSVPETAGVVRPRPGIAWILYLARVHVLVEAGEVIGIPDETRRAAASFYFGGGRRKTS